MHLAAEENSLLTFPNIMAEMRFLEDSEQDIIAEIMEFGTALLIAATQVDLQELERVLHNNKTPVICWHVKKIVQWAIEENHPEVIEVLLTNGLDLTHSAFKGFLPAVVMKFRSHFEGMKTQCECLLAGGIHIDDSDLESSSTALHMACLVLDIDIVEYLVAKGACVNAINIHNQMPLNFVEKLDCEDGVVIAEFLRSRGAESKWNSYMGR